MSDAIVAICITAMIILCAGEPDMLDALIKRVGTVECSASKPGDSRSE